MLSAHSGQRARRRPEAIPVDLHARGLCKAGQQSKGSIWKPSNSSPCPCHKHAGQPVDDRCVQPTGRYPRCTLFLPPGRDAAAPPAPNKMKWMRNSVHLPALPGRLHGGHRECFGAGHTAPPQSLRCTARRAASTKNYTSTSLSRCPSLAPPRPMVSADSRCPYQRCACANGRRKGLLRDETRTIVTAVVSWIRTKTREHSRQCSMRAGSIPYPVSHGGVNV